MKTLRLSLFGILLTAFIAACGAPSNQGALDKARFALDKCSVDNVGPCATADSESMSVLESDSTNVEAALVRSSALATTGGANMLNLVSEISKTGTSGGVDNDTQKFKVMHTAIVGTVRDINDLRTSIETLQPPTFTAPPAEGVDYHRDYYFQIGILQAFEAFTLPTVKAQPTSTSAVDITQITSADKDNVQSDFLDADDNLVTSGITDSSVNGWDIVTAVRQNYCVLKNITGGPGFTHAVLQDMILCQLCAGVTDTSICAKEAGDLGVGDFQSPLVTKCSDFNFTACNNAGPTAL